jgi:hypothetical protein
MTTFAAVLVRVAEDVAAAQAELNQLDGVAGDGDLGLTMTTGARALIAIAPELESLDLAAAVRRCGAELARKAPSTSRYHRQTTSERAGSRACSEPNGYRATWQSQCWRQNTARCTGTCSGCRTGRGRSRTGAMRDVAGCRPSSNGWCGGDEEYACESRPRRLVGGSVRGPRGRRGAPGGHGSCIGRPPRVPGTFWCGIDLEKITMIWPIGDLQYDERSIAFGFQMLLAQTAARPAQSQLRSDGIERPPRPGQADPHPAATVRNSLRGGAVQPPVARSGMPR